MKNSRPKVSATFVIFEQLPKVKNHPVGENLPNLVTLFTTLGLILYGRRKSFLFHDYCERFGCVISPRVARFYRQNVPNWGYTQLPLN
jgi:hypothetical protein